VSEKIEFKISVTRDELSKALDGAADSAKKTKKEISSLGDVFRQAGEEMSRLKASFIGNLGANAVSKGINLLTDGFRASIQAAREFSRAVAEINSVLPNGTKLTEAQTKALAKLSEQYGTSAAQQAKGFFEIVSGGVENTATAFKILSAANNAALSGLVDINTATRLITSTFNAYSEKGVSAAQVTDTLVAVTQASSVKFEEMAQTMGRVTNIAAQSGVSIGELGGSVAFLNTRSLTTEQAVTGLAGILSEVSKPSQEAARAAKALGIEFSVSAIQSKGLVGFLQEVTEKTNGNVTAIRKLFADQRAGNAAVAIASGEFEKYAKIVDKVTKSNGEAARASRTIKESLDFKLDQLTNSFNSFAIAVGTKVGPAITVLTNAIKGLKLVLDGNPQSIDENRNKLQSLAVEYNKNVDAISRLKSQLEQYKLIGATASENITQEQLNKILTRQNEIIKERIALRSSSLAKPSSDGGVVDSGEGESAVDPQAKTDALNQLKLAQAEQLLAKQQFAYDLRALEGTLREEDLIALQEAERQKIDAVYAAELEKTKLITDAEAQRTAIQAINAKKQLDMNNLNNRRSIESKRAQIALEKTFQDQKNSIIMQSFGLAAALAKDGSKTQFLIQKAAALAEVAIARGKAIAMVPAQTAHLPFPSDVPAKAALIANANTSAAIGAATIAATAIKGFAAGGIIGGANGATNGSDNRIATVRDGEMVLNASQQEKLFDMINAGGSGNIVIQIDGRNIAYAVRDQIKAGFKLS
jgi:TP901 family phage tail tape measure protein